MLNNLLPQQSVQYHYINLKQLLLFSLIIYGSRWLSEPTLYDKTYVNKNIISLTYIFTPIYLAPCHEEFVPASLQCAKRTKLSLQKQARKQGKHQPKVALWPDNKLISSRFSIYSPKFMVFALITPNWDIFLVLFRSSLISIGSN